MKITNQIPFRKKATKTFWEEWRETNTSTLGRLDPQKVPEKPLWKKIFKWVKFIIYFLMVFFAIWGCVQQFAEEQVVTARVVGVGFEMGQKGDILIGSHSISETSVNLNAITGSEVNYFRLTSFDNAWYYGPFYAMFVYPLGQLTIIMTKAFSDLPKDSGVLLAIFFLVTLIRGTSLVLNLRSYQGQEAMRDIQGKIGDINAKYQGREDKVSKQKKQMEIMQLYRGIGTSPFAAFSTFMLTSPFFYSMYRVISSARIVKETELGPFSFTTTPLQAMQEGHWEYLLMIFMVIPIQALSFLLPRILSMSKEQQRQKRLKKIRDETMPKKKGGMGKFAEKMPFIMIGVFSLFSIGLPVGVAFYWTFSAFFSCLQNSFFHFLRYMKKKRKQFGKKPDPSITEKIGMLFKNKKTQFVRIR